MSYSDRFNTLTVCLQASRVTRDSEGEPVLDENGEKVYEDYLKTYDVKDLHMSNADLFLVALAILVDIEQKESRRNPKNEGFLKAYRQVRGGFSLKRAAERIVALHDAHAREEFAPEMFFSYKRWGRGKMVKREGKRTFISDTFDDECGYDPYVFSASQAKTSLSQASTTLLAKGFRFFLEETLRHFFQKSDPNAWYPYTDEKTKKRVLPEFGYMGSKSSATFSAAVSELLDIFDGVYSLSPHLTEFVEATEKAVEAGRADRDAKTAERLASVASHRSYGVSDGKPRAQAEKKAPKKEQSRADVPAEPRKPKVMKVTTVDDEGWITTSKIVARQEDAPHADS